MLAGMVRRIARISTALAHFIISSVGMIPQ
jgi:hypothetical protein